MNSRGKALELVATSFEPERARRYLAQAVCTGAQATTLTTLGEIDPPVLTKIVEGLFEGSTPQ
ncbi:hypothetical protein AB0F43_20985 [Kribbella sp. NPDC023972]|uniref:hypothetical protein n=1 Tax=Kribbella sp. NPDC023972 TaxID=3154795 RepID=UPI0033D49C36